MNNKKKEKPSLIELNGLLNNNWIIWLKRKDVRDNSHIYKLPEEGFNMTVQFYEYLKNNHKEKEFAFCPSSDRMDNLFRIYTNDNEKLSNSLIEGIFNDNEEYTESLMKKLDEAYDEFTKNNTNEQC